MKKKNTMALTAILSLGLILSACGNDNAKDKEANNKAQVEEKADTETKDKTSKENDAEKKEESTSDQKMDEVSLADWEGKWNSMSAYLDKNEVQGAFTDLAKKENTDEESAKKAYVEKRHCDFNGLEIEGNKVKFYNEFPDEGKEATAEVEYKYVDKQEVKHGNHMLEWDIFEAVSPDAEYKYLLMMPINGEESLTHFHMRYGNDKDELLGEEKWFPTFVKPNTTDQQIMDEITE